MKVKLITWNVRGLNNQNSRVLIRNLLHKWRADVYCLQETKINNNIEEIAKQLGSCRWMRCGYLEADGSKGGILIMWDSKVWSGVQIEVSQHSVTYEFKSTQNSFTWYFTGVYAPHTRGEKLLCWEELAVVRQLCDGPWVTGGDFNTNRKMEERRGCNRITNVMSDFSKWIEDMELHDTHLNGGKYTLFRGINHPSAARLDRFLFCMGWDETFKNISQRLLPRITSDHCPVVLECGNWENKRSNFKFENWWLKVEGFNELIHGWWNEIEVEGCPDYKLSFKLRVMKQKLKEWSKNTFGELINKKNNLLEELAEIDLAQESRDLSVDEMMVRATIIVELEELAKNEESRWRQNSRVLWLKQGDNNTKYFQRMATAHKKYNTIDRLNVRGKETKEPGEIKEAMIEFYKKLYCEPEDWRPTFQLLDCPTISQEEQEWLQRPFTEVEVLSSLKLCDGDKAPGPDGFTMSFFKAC